MREDLRSPAGQGGPVERAAGRRPGLSQVETAEQFAVRRREIAAAAKPPTADLADMQNKLTEAAVERKG